jgi:CTP synthase
MVQKIHARSNQVVIAIVGKYVKLPDAYLSIIESLNYAGFELGIKVKIKWVDSEEVTDRTVHELVGGVDGILIPGGFGERGIEGKITACQYARENNIPFLGICLGMQVAVIEYARNVCRLDGAHSTEFDKKSPNPVIALMDEQIGIVEKGGTMRLGAYPCQLKENSVLHRLYGEEQISERHRHRFEVNNAYRNTLVENGLVISGTSPDNHL